MWTLFDIECAEPPERGAAPRSSFPVVVKNRAYDRANNSYDIPNIRVPASGKVPLVRDHDKLMLPLGSADSFQWSPNVLRAMLHFDEGDEEAMQVAGKVERGYLTSVSGGFRDVKREFVDDPQDKRNYYMGLRYPEYYMGRTRITSAELVEVSLTNFPADRYATITASATAPAQLPSNAELRQWLGLPAQ